VETNSVELNYENFQNTYFAPRRILSALDWEHPDLDLRSIFRTRVSVLGQFDLAEKYLHSQYVAVKLTIPIDAFSFNLGGSVEFIEKKKKNDVRIAAVGEIGASWMLPTYLGSRFSFLGRYGGGNSKMDAFIPLTSKSQGSVLKPKVPGISMMSLDYTVRLHRTFSAVLSTSYFIRNDLSYTGYPCGTEDTGYFLGDELYGRLYWGPASDLMIYMGGGVFLPALGNAAPKEKNMWKIELGVTLSIY
jgi:hypothetical protein